MERWVHTRAFASVLGPRGRASLDAPPHGAKSSLDDDVPTPRLGRGVEPVTGGTVSDASHPSLRCEPTMTIPRTFTSYVSGYGESAVSTLSASEQSSVVRASTPWTRGVRTSVAMQARLTKQPGTCARGSSAMPLAETPVKCARISPPENNQESLEITPPLPIGHTDPPLTDG